MFYSLFVTRKQIVIFLSQNQSNVCNKEDWSTSRCFLMISMQPDFGSILTKNNILVYIVQTK